MFYSIITKCSNLTLYNHMSFLANNMKSFNISNICLIKLIYDEITLSITTIFIEH